MIKNALAIRLWAFAILVACIAFGALPERMEAQAPSSSAQATQLATRTLLDKARDLEARGRRDLAIQAWQQVLLAEPDNVEALRNLARATRLSGDAKLSDTYERQLRTVSPKDASAVEAEGAALSPAQTQQLTQAGTLADDGNYAAAMKIYRQVFGTHPSGDWAVAYYETEAATDGGREPAVEGLRALVGKYPDQSRYQIALGRILTYNPSTREEGRKFLQKFANDPQAAQAFRQSLIWDAANPAVAPQIRAYLASHQDPQLAAVFQMTQQQAGAGGTAAGPIASTQKTSSGSSTSAGTPVASTATPAAPAGVTRPSQSMPKPSTPSPALTADAGTHTAATPASSRASAPTAAPDGSTARGRAAEEVAAYQALNAGRLIEAETRFKAILAADPRNPKALAGMGYVRMQQGNFLGAISFLEQAKEATPDDKPLLAALDTARFWFIMGEGQNALNSNDLTTAEKRYRSALELRPDSPEALEGMGGTLLKAQEPSPAISLFEHAVALQPASADGWRGLFMAQFQGGNTALALTTVKRIPPAPLAQLMTDPLFLQPLASAYYRVGRVAGAESTLESALKQRFPPEVKGLKADIQIQLAGTFSSTNQLDQAEATYRQVVADDSGDVAAWQGLVRVEHAMGHNDAALQTIQSMPPTVYAAAMRDTGFEIAVASVYEAKNKLDVAQDLLQKAVTEQTNAGQKPSPAIEMQLANIYAERGSPQLAYPVYQQVLRDDPDRADAWAGLLSALHVTGHNKEAVEQLKLVPAAVRPQLEANPSYLQTMASVYGDLGRSREATMFLGRVEQGYAAHKSAPPATLEIQNAWLLYNGMDDAGLYRELMALGGRTDLTADQRRTVQTIWTNWAVRRANQAAALGNLRRALAILNATARAFPDNPAAIKSLAIGYVQAGEPHEAVLIYKAQNMSSASAPEYEAAISAALAGGDNKDAEIWLRYALAAYPADPQILILAAKFEQARGDTAKAIKYYRASLRAMPPASLSSKLTSDLGLPAPLAPLSLPSPNQPQALSILLAPGNSDLTPEAAGSGEPYLPSYPKLPPFDPTSRLVPPYMSNPDGKPSGDESPAHAQSGEVASAVRDATNRELGRVEPAASTTNQQSAAAVNSTTPPGSASDESYSPYVAYVAPQAAPPHQTAKPDPRLAIPSAVAVQLGDNSPRPSQPQADVTDVLPTARYAASAKARQAEASHAEVAAARADRIRRLQDDSNARTGQSHPPPGESITVQNAEYITPAQSAPQVAQPTTPAGRQIGNVPDTGAQQYPQPRTQPGTAPPTTITRARPAPRTSAPAPPLAATPPAAVSEPTAPPTASVAVTQPQQLVAPPAVVVPMPAPTAPPMGPAYPLAPPPTDAELRALNLPPLGGYFEAQVPLPMTPRQQAESELSSLEGSYSGWFGGTGLGRYRAGNPGIDRLYDVEAPAEASVVIDRSTRLTAVAVPVFLNSGLPNNANFASGSVPYLGTQPANQAGSTGQQFSNGIGGELQLTTRNIALAVGYTPYEFLVHNVTGRIRWSTLGGHVTVFGDRQPVKDTQLSYAGLYDPGASLVLALRPIWGGVIATGGGARLDFGSGVARFYVSGDGGILTGTHVQNNYRFGGTTGATFRVGYWPEHGSLVIGGALTGMHYDRDEVGLSYGQGGYFSPDSYFLASVPISFNGQYKTNFHYTIAAALGVQTFEQAEAPFFPLDPALQSSFVPSNGAICTASQSPSINCGEYPLTDTTALSYSVSGEASYRFAEHWYGGVFLSSSNSNNYNDVAAGFFFRYVFRAQHSPEGYPAGLFRVDGLRPLQIP
jgi:tetratricopeptide (TPR) repeat protein